MYREIWRRDGEADEDNIKVDLSDVDWRRYLELGKRRIYREIWRRDGEADEDNIKVDLSDVDCGDRRITELTQDRVRWQALI
jgi:hypothetical protein